MARIAPETIVELAREAMAPDADALFVSCTALRAAVAVPDIEQATRQAGGEQQPGNRLELPAAVRRRGGASRTRPSDDAAAGRELSVMPMDFVTLDDIQAARASASPARSCATPMVPSPSPQPACRRAGPSEARTPPDDRQLQAARRDQRHRLAVGRREAPRRRGGLDRQSWPRRWPMRRSSRACAR